MKRIFLLASAILFMFASCTTDKLPDADDPATSEDPSAGLPEATVTATGLNWGDNSKIGVFTSDDMNMEFTLTGGAGTSEGTFTGRMTEGAVVLSAYYPYNKDVADMSSCEVNIPAEVDQATGEKVGFAIATLSAENTLAFKAKLATLVIKFSGLEQSVWSGKPISSIKVQAPRPLVGDYRANLSNVTTGLVPVKGTSELTINFPENTVLNDEFEATALIAALVKGQDKFTITAVVDGATLSGEATLDASAVEGQPVELTVPASIFNPKVTVAWSYALPVVSGNNYFAANVPAVDASGNVYFTNFANNKLTKLSNTGAKLWEYTMDCGVESGQGNSPALEADGSVLYMAYGNGGKATVYAIDPASGSAKWTCGPSQFFGNGSTPAPNINRHHTPAIGKNCIYVGNGGTAGSLISIDKATGKRVAYVSSNEDGTGGPAGGATAGVVVTKDNMVAIGSKYGIFTASADSLENPQRTHATYGKYVQYNTRIHTDNWSNLASNLACFSHKGVCNVVALGANDPGATIFYGKSKSVDNNTKVAITLAMPKDAKAKKQDQGGVVVGPRNEIIASYKHNTDVPGGVYAADPATGELSWKFVCNMDVEGAAAVDNNGYVHIAGRGTYFIVKPDYNNKSASVVAQVTLEDLLKSAGVTNYGSNARVWSSVIIGKDGKIYLATDYKGDDDVIRGILLCLSYALTTGAGDTPWPMYAADCLHTGRQQK